jgi:hypothetical protein
MPIAQNIEYSESRNNSIDWLKWLAVITMFIDHLRFVPQLNNEILYTIGRASYPLFAIICGWNIALYTKNQLKFSKRVLLFGLGLMALAPIGPIFPLPLNPLITLGLGLFLCIPVLRFQSDRTKLLIAVTITACSLLLSKTISIDMLIAYDWVGIAMIPIAALLAVYTSNDTNRKIMSKTGYYRIFYFFVICIIGYDLNEELKDRLLGLLWTIIGIRILYIGKLPKCPLPNNYWLYLAFPLSMLIPTIVYHLSKH